MKNILFVFIGIIYIYFLFKNNFYFEKKLNLNWKMNFFIIIISLIILIIPIEFSIYYIFTSFPNIKNEPIIEYLTFSESKHRIYFIYNNIAFDIIKDKFSVVLVDFNETLLNKTYLFLSIYCIY